MGSGDEHVRTTEGGSAADDASARLATPPAAAPLPQEEDLCGRRLASRYLLEAQLGSGPIGTVYRARCDDGSQFAVKVLAAKHRADANVVRRFLRAAQVTRELQHPNILMTLDHGEDEGIPFLCREMAAGLPIDRALAARPLTLRRALTPLCDVLSALAEAHRQGTVHRCLKPANVLVEERADGTLVTRLCDFDFGRLLKPVPGTARTKHGASCGEAEYMAPEQALTTEIDGRADVYSVGVIMYALLAGRVPFSGTRPEEILAKHQNEPPISPRSLREDRTIPREVESICLRALAKRPGDRYQSPREMSSALRATLELFGARADLPIEEPEVVLDDSVHTVSKDRLTMPGEQLRSRQKVGVGAALLFAVCAVIWLSAPRESGEQAAPQELRSVQQAALVRAQAESEDPVSRGRRLLQAGQALAALKELETARASMGEPPELLRLLGEALLKVGQRERGRALLQRYLADDPGAEDRAAVEALLAEP